MPGAWPPLELQTGPIHSLSRIAVHSTSKSLSAGYIPSTNSYSNSSYRPFPDPSSSSIFILYENALGEMSLMSLAAPPIEIEDWTRPQLHGISLESVTENTTQGSQLTRPSAVVRDLWDTFGAMMICTTFMDGNYSFPTITYIDGQVVSSVDSRKSRPCARYSRTLAELTYYDGGSRTHVVQGVRRRDP